MVMDAADHRDPITHTHKHTNMPQTSGSGISYYRYYLIINDNIFEFICFLMPQTSGSGVWIMGTGTKKLKLGTMDGLGARTRTSTLSMIRGREERARERKRGRARGGG